MRRALIWLMTASLLLLPHVGGPWPALAEEPAAPPADWSELGQERTQLEEQAARARKEEEAAVAELFVLNRRLEEIQREINRLDREVAAVAAEQAEAEQKRDDLDRELRDRQAQFGRRARYYQEHGSFAPLGFLLQAGSFSDFLVRIDLISQVLARDARLMKEIRELTAQVVEQERILTAKRDELTRLRAEQTAQAERQQNEIRTKESLLAGLREQRSKVEGRVAELEQVWTRSAVPVLESFGQVLQTVGLKVTDVTPDSVQLSLFPPGATVRVSQQNLNDFLQREGALKELRFVLKPGEANLEGVFDGIGLRIRGRFAIKSKTVLRYEPLEIRFMDFLLPPSVGQELLASGRLDIDYSALIGPWAMQEILMEESAMVVKAGLR